MKESQIGQVNAHTLSQVTQLPSPGASYCGVTLVLVTPGFADKIVICLRKSNLQYAWFEWGTEEVVEPEIIIPPIPMGTLQFTYVVYNNHTDFGRNLKKLYATGPLTGTIDYGDGLGPIEFPGDIQPHDYPGDAVMTKTIVLYTQVSLITEFIMGAGGLATIDFSPLINLEHIVISANRIGNTPMTNLVNSLPDRTGLTPGHALLCPQEVGFCQVLGGTRLGIMTAKNWVADTE
jgi:hypothetical protein